MRRIATLAIMLLAAACSDPEPMDDTSAEAGTASSSSGGEEAGDESSSGGMMEWSGSAALLRVAEPVTHCRDACGVSQCTQALNADGLSIGCDSAAAEIECTCADFTDGMEASSTHAISSCYLNANSSREAAVDPPSWTLGSCEDFCGSFGFSCYGTIWADGRDCPDIEADWGRRYYPDGPTTRPDGVDAAGAFVVVCEI